MVKNHKGGFKFDVILAAAVGFLLLFGLIMITSIGVPKSIMLSAPDILYPSCSDEAVDCYLLFKKHLMRLAAGLLAFLIAYKLPIKIWRKFAPLMFVAMVGLLLFVMVAGESFGTIASNWIRIFDTSIQPSEFARLVLIFYLSYWFSKRAGTVESFQDGFLPFCFVLGLIVLPVVLQNDFGASLVLCLIGVSIYFMAGARLRHLALGFFVALFAMIIAIATVSHVQERFKGFTSIDEECLEDYCWQSQQANIAVGSGGFFGKGLTQGVQKSYWLPQASDDFIFAASAEELGFIRIVLVVIAYFMIGWRGYAIARGAQNTFESYLAVGITTWIVAQAYINIGVNTALMPVTGITLPFVSYGGSSLVASLVGIGILLKISENSDETSSGIYRRGNRRAYRPQLRRYRRG
ncbi:cell division protein FtsW [Candidatus Gracilibacteria bacterium]|nr:cell division protein FtsW [Candidatus Gracilibacteria bacterium]